MLGEHRGALAARGEAAGGNTKGGRQVWTAAMATRLRPPRLAS